MGRVRGHRAALRAAAVVLDFGWEALDGAGFVPLGFSTSRWLVKVWEADPASTRFPSTEGSFRSGFLVSDWRGGQRQRAGVSSSVRNQVSWLLLVLPPNGGS